MPTTMMLPCERETPAVAIHALTRCLLATVFVLITAIPIRADQAELSPKPERVEEIIRPLEVEHEISNLVGLDGRGVCQSCDEGDRFWLISTRHLTSQARCVNLEQPGFAVSQLRPRQCSVRVTIDDYLQAIGERRSVVVYVHGNRVPAHEALQRGLSIHHKIKRFRSGQSIDWVIWSWPSDKQGILIRDARIKASRTDGQGLYLGWLLRKHAELQAETTLIGYSFGGRIITGSLHAAAGGSLAGRQLPGPPLLGANFDAGLVAPAVDSHWLTDRGYHRLATQNMNRLVLLYNRRDAVLKRYWLVDRVRGRMALGYSGPTSFAPRFDGTKLPVRSRDCSPSIGIQHDEMDYYRKSCRADSEMAKLIDDFYVNE